METVQILVKKLTAVYSSNCHFKIKIVSNSSPNKESAENKHSFKYDKNSSEVNINETLELNINDSLTFEHKFQFFLEVYTKTGYKTAGIGILQLSNDIKLKTPININIQKCPLGKGALEIEFIKLDLISQNHKQSIDMYNNTNSNINPNLTNTYETNNNSNFVKQSNISTTMNSDLIREKDQQIKELKTKIDYYEEENNELKNLVNDFKKEKKKLMEEKNTLISQYKEQIQNIKNEKEDIQIQLMTLQQNMDTLENNKSSVDQKVINIKNQTDKQIKELSQQIKNLNNIKFELENENKLKDEKIMNLERKNNEISMNYKKQLNEMDSNFSSEKNNVLYNHTNQLNQKEEEIQKLNVKIRSMEEHIQSLNEIIGPISPFRAGKQRCIYAYMAGGRPWPRKKEHRDS